jgi:cytochrome c oxidase cbb3-type subunit 3
MIDAVTHGRPETAMTSFASVLSAADVQAVVDYLRQTFMGPAKPLLHYHTAANGWPDHSRYVAAFPFVTGELALGQRWETLSTAQQQGKRLYLNACVSCHDHGTRSDDGPVWELRALSYPRKHYSHRVDMISGASPYAVHDIPPRPGDLSPQEALGERLYQDNCAFCHAADGTARNWIGSFLQPRPRDLTGFALSDAHTERLKQVIRNGLPGTSMPAWQQVLGNHEIDAIVVYLRRAFRGSDTLSADGS